MTWPRSIKGASINIIVSGLGALNGVLIVLGQGDAFMVGFLLLLRGLSLACLVFHYLPGLAGEFRGNPPDTGGAVPLGA